MNARELLDLIDKHASPHGVRVDGLDVKEIILRALRLLAAAESNDGTTPETDAHDAELGVTDSRAGDVRLYRLLARRLERERNGLAARVGELEEDAERIAFLGEQNRWNGGTGYSIFMLDSGDVYVRPMKPENAASVGVTVHPDIRSAIDSVRSKP